MQDIADEAGLSAGSLYNYFDGKEGLIDALAELGVERVDAVMACLSGHGSLRDVLEALLSRFATTLVTGEGRAAARFNVAAWCEALSNPRLAERMASVDHRLEERIAERAISACNRGELASDVDPESAAEVVSIYLTGMIVRAALDPTFDANTHWHGVGVKMMRGQLWS